MWISHKQWQMGQILLLPIHRKLPAVFRLVFQHLILSYFEGKNEGHTNFNCEYLAKRWQMSQTLILSKHMQSLIGFQLAYLHLTSAHSKGQGQSQFDCEKFENWVTMHYVSIFAALSRLSYLKQIPIWFCLYGCSLVFSSFFWGGVEVGKNVDTVSVVCFQWG